MPAGRHHEQNDEDGYQNPLEGRTRAEFGGRAAYAGPYGSGKSAYLPWGL